MRSGSIAHRFLADPVVVEVEPVEGRCAHVFFEPVGVTLCAPLQGFLAPFARQLDPALEEFELALVGTPATVGSESEYHRDAEHAGDDPGARRQADRSAEKAHHNKALISACPVRHYADDVPGFD